LHCASAHRNLGRDRSLPAHSDTEGGKIQNDHHKGEKVHSHCQPNHRVHYQDADQPKQAGLPYPNEKWVTEFE
jgi:hypothetical protein